MADDVDDLAQRERALRIHIDTLGRLYKKTNNPVVVWAAMAVQYQETLRRRLGRRPPLALIIPDWAEDYLLRSAREILWLADGMDIRKDRKVLNHTIVQDMAADRAMERVTAALQFTRKGYNAFKDFASHGADINAAMKFSQISKSGLKYDAAIQALHGQSKATDPSVLRKRVTRGRKLLSVLSDKTKL